jgi:thiol-disulfide isomerase/thioredoxin
MLAAVLLAASFTGQVVCSGCWEEADRSKVPYGTDADVECAKRCAGDGLSRMLAVRGPDGAYTLYELKARKLGGGKETFLPAIGATVEVEGSLTTGADKRVLEVDTMRVVTPRGGAAAGPARAGPLALRDLSGIEQSLEALRGRLVVLNFWATWCKPCVEEMPDLAKLQARYGAWGVQVVGAAADGPEGRDAVLSFIKKTPVGFPIWLGATTDQMTGFGLPPVLPGTVVLARDGSIAATFAGKVKPSEVAAALDRLLQEGTTVAAGPPRAGASQVPP